MVYYDDPLLTLHRFAANVAAADASGEDLMAFGAQSVFGEKLWVERLLRRHMGVLGKDDVLHVARHHLSHAASAFYPSPFESAAIITADGVGEWNTTTIGVGRGNKIEMLKKIDYPHSLGLLYSAFTYFCGFRVNFGDYKLMGLAPYGEPVYTDLIKREIIDIKPDGSYRLNLKYFDFQNGRAMTNDAFAQLFGGARREPEARITKREMDMAASVQKVVEEVMVRLARTAREITGERNLVMAGGVALNCVANGVLLREKVFDNLWVQPAAGDAGGALGAALAYYHQHLGMPREVCVPDAQQGSYLGPAFDGEQIRAYLESQGAPYRAYEGEELFSQVAKLLDEQKVVGLFEGRMEYGPRALGNRSIIADPRSEQMQSRMNLSIKHRESFRPFAPAVLAERASEYFELEGASPYMLLCAQVRGRLDEDFALHEQLRDDEDLIAVINRKRSELPAITHVDYSARIQTVTSEANPTFYGIIKAFEQLTGCGVVINTSFNVRGEPIVCTPQDAYECFMDTEMDALVLGDCVLLKEEQPAREKRQVTYELD